MVAPHYPGALVPWLQGGSPGPVFQGRPKAKVPNAQKPSDMVQRRGHWGNGPAPPKPPAHNIEHLHLVVSGTSETSLTFIFFNTCRPGRKAGTGRFCILWEIIHVAVGKARKWTSLMFSVQGNTAVGIPSLVECLHRLLPQETYRY